MALHHPPIPTGIHDFDTGIPLALEDREALAALARQPDLIVSGHIHLPICGTLGPTPVFVCPSVHLQAAFDLRPDAGIRLVEDPPGYGVHVRGDDLGLVSYVRPLPQRRPTN